jgi:alpha-glucosidase (family GH31 glycosyl hydrolase)
MEEGIYTVREIKESHFDSEKELILLDCGMSGFQADAGEYEVGDKVEVEQYEDYKGNTGYRAVGKV